MEHEGSLPHSQEPANCPYPEPAQCSPYPHIPLPENPPEYYPPIYAWVSQVVFNLNNILILLTKFIACLLSFFSW